MMLLLLADGLIQPLDANYFLSRLIGMIFFALLVCTALLLFARWSQKHQSGLQLSSNAFQYVDGLILNQTCSLHLISVNGHWILIATDTKGIQDMRVLDFRDE